MVFLIKETKLRAAARESCKSNVFASKCRLFMFALGPVGFLCNFSIQYLNICIRYFLILLGQREIVSGVMFSIGIRNGFHNDFHRCVGYVVRHRVECFFVSLGHLGHWCTGAHCGALWRTGAHCGALGRTGAHWGNGAMGH